MWPSYYHKLLLHCITVFLHHVAAQFRQQDNVLACEVVWIFGFAISEYMIVDLATSADTGTGQLT